LEYHIREFHNQLHEKENLYESENRTLYFHRSTIDLDGSPSGASLHHDGYGGRGEAYMELDQETPQT
jgi:hypothetical protein